MACKNICKLCDKLILSNSVAYASGVLTINIPEGAYLNGEKYCIVIAQTIPNTAILDAVVVITIGTGSATYPLQTKNCKQVTAQMLRNRTKYSTEVVTSSTSGAFRLLGCLCNDSGNDLPYIDGTA